MQYCGGTRAKITTPINISNFLATGACTFEVDSPGADIDFHNIVEESVKENMENDKDFFEEISLKSIPVAHYIMEESMMDFDEHEQTWDEISPGVYKKLMKPGKGDLIESGTKVSILYSAIAEMADKPFDDRTDPRYPMRFYAGKGEVILGLDIAVLSMKQFEISKFLLHPKVAYGKMGHFPRIPANTKVLFTIEVVESKLFMKETRVLEMTEDELNQLPFSEIIKAAESLKDDGKKAYEKRDYAEAVLIYSKAAIMLENYPILKTSDDRARNNLLFKLLNNLALCYELLEQPKKALKACETSIGLEIDGRKDKPYYRMGKLYYNMGKLENAKEMLDKALEIDHQNYDTTQLYEKVVEQSEAENKDRDHLFKKMIDLGL